MSPEQLRELSKQVLANPLRAAPSPKRGRPRRLDAVKPPPPPPVEDIRVATLRRRIMALNTEIPLKELRLEALRRERQDAENQLAAILADRNTELTSETP